VKLLARVEFGVVDILINDLMILSYITHLFKELNFDDSRNLAVEILI
jgi:hypothetical protein